MKVFARLYQTNANLGTMVKNIFPFETINSFIFSKISNIFVFIQHFIQVNLTKVKEALF